MIDTDRHGRIPLGCLTTASMKGRDETMLNAMDDVVEARSTRRRATSLSPSPPQTRHLLLSRHLSRHLPRHFGGMADRAFVERARYRARDSGERARPVGARESNAETIEDIKDRNDESRVLRPRWPVRLGPQCNEHGNDAVVLVDDNRP